MIILSGLPSWFVVRASSSGATGSLVWAALGFGLLAASLLVLFEVLMGLSVIDRVENAVCRPQQTVNFATLLVQAVTAWGTAIKGPWPIGFVLPFAFHGGYSRLVGIVEISGVIARVNGW